ncbi:binding-protein-dependent transport systems inner membrane component [Halothermothrix orenii H 168]|uniref:Binding-protein-dependent transport systems inner membrane component n=2 Tax=Halothermothrix orenii TaxID=31909 RepID=B8D192_HALOH|nr:binding-protein-dependent transport systems inner membrane component [Halothermothrix orenii H 168]
MKKYVPYFLIAPAFLVLLLLMVYPIIWNIYLSFHDVTLIKLNRAWEPVALRNYFNVITDMYFWESMWVTGKFVVGSVVGQLVFGLILALLLHKKVKGSGMFRVIYIIPWLLSDVIVGFTWQWSYHEKFGMINTLLGKLGIPAIDWLGNPDIAIWAIVITNIWFGTPFTMLFLGSALNTISRELYEAARVDGATRWQQFWYVTIPALKPFIATNLILLTMWTVNLFGLQYVMTGGGPLFSTTTLSLFMYNNAFEYGKLSIGSSIGFILLIINAIAAYFYVKLVQREG